MDILEFLLALSPIAWLIFALLALKWPAWKATIGTFILSAVLAASYWSMPVDEILTAGLEGSLMAIWPILLVILSAVFTYNVCVSTGAMRKISSMISSISGDRRLLALLLAWCFGCFMEGVAGFGVAIAIPSGMLLGLGFDPLEAIVVCLFANTAPTAFGSIGIPTITLAGLLQLHDAHLAVIEMIQSLPYFLLAPFFVVLVAGRVEGSDGKTVPVPRRFRGVLVPTLVSGVSAAIASFLVAFFVGSELTMIVGALTSLVATAVAARIAEKRGHLDPVFDVAPQESGEAGTEKLDVVGALKSWSCFIIIFVVLLVTSDIDPDIYRELAPIATTVRIFDGPGANAVTFTWIDTPGVWIFLAAIIGGFIQGASLRQLLQVLGATAKQLIPTSVTMIFVLASSKIMSYSGMISAISAFCIAVTGSYFTLVSPWIGALGSFVTGSGTTSAILFGTVQGEAAAALGIDPYWIAGLNEMGAAVGKMISPQSFAIGMSAVNVQGKSPELMRRMLPYVGVFMVLVSLFAYLGAGLL